MIATIAKYISWIKIRIPISDFEKMKVNVIRKEINRVLLISKKNKYSLLLFLHFDTAKDLTKFKVLIFKNLIWWNWKAKYKDYKNNKPNQNNKWDNKRYNFKNIEGADRAYLIDSRDKKKLVDLKYISDKQNKVKIEGNLILNYTFI